MSLYLLLFFFFNDTATTEIYTLSLHDALPIFGLTHRHRAGGDRRPGLGLECCIAPVPTIRDSRMVGTDRKSTRLNSSHTVISYAVFCLKKKKTEPQM